MQFDWTVNIPSLLSIGAVLIGLFRVHASYVRLEFKVDELWDSYKNKENR